MLDERLDVDSASYHAAEVVELPLEKLKIDERYQPRLAGTNTAHIASLKVSEPADWPPLLVSPDGCRYVVIDGAHRLEAAGKLGLKTVRCVVQERAGYPEAVAANLAHGLPLSIADRKAFVCWLHNEEPALSHRELGRQSGLSHHTVAAALRAGREKETGQLAQSAAPKPNAIERMVDLLYKATNDGIGRSFFGGDSTVRTVRAAIAAYEDDVQPELARQAGLWGAACIKAAMEFGVSPDQFGLHIAKR